MPANAADCLQAVDIKIQYGIWNIEYRLGNMKSGELGDMKPFDVNFTVA